MKTIRAKITTTILLVSLLSLGVLSAVVLTNIMELKTEVTHLSDDLGHSASTDSSQALTNEIYLQLQNLATAKADLISERVEKLQNYVNMSADYAEMLYENPDSVADELGLMDNIAPFLQSICSHDSDIENTYYSTTSGINILVDSLSDPKGDVMTADKQSWYKKAVAAHSLIWTDVFEDRQGRGLYITCAAPVIHDDTLMGVVGYDMSTEILGENIIDTTVGKSGYIFVVNETGRIIISAHMSTDVTGATIRDNLLNNADPALIEVNNRVLNRESGIAQLNYQGNEVLMAYQPVDTLPWTVIAITDYAEAMAPAVTIGNRIDSATDSTALQMDTIYNDMILAIAIIVVLSALFIIKISMVLSKRITRPLGHLIRGVESIAVGNLDTYIMVTTNDEIFRLADAFNSMSDNLQQQIAELTAVTAEKERIGAELEVATQIQASMLPCIFPAFPEHKEFDIFATMEPAKEVGGDFYDFFLIDENHLGLVMADVSGKGVPAALFMVIAKTLIKNHAQLGQTPSQVLTEVNDQLCETNDAGMFVTCWMGVLDLRNGLLTYGNAGHNPPLICRHGGQFEYLQMTPGLVLAGMDGIVYRQAELTLEKGDTLYLYTDGVTEATSLQNELYGEDRLQTVLNDHSTAPLDEMLRAVKLDIDRFVDEAPQFDDITMLALIFDEQTN